MALRLWKTLFGRPDARTLGFVLFGAFAGLFWARRIVAPARGFGLLGLDLFLQVYPGQRLAAEILRAGSLPLWNPFNLCGRPFLTSALYGVFYPPNVVYLPLPAEVAIEISTVLHLALAGFFAFLYVRKLGAAFPAALAAGLAYGFSGFVVRESFWFTPALAAATWLPFGMLGVERIIDRPGFRSAWVLSVAVAMVLLAGWYQTAVYSLYAWAFVFTVRAVAEARREGLRHAGKAALVFSLAVLWGVGLSAAQLLPTVELLELSPRRPGSLAEADILRYGTPSPLGFLRGALAPNGGVPPVSYVGVTSLVVLLASFFRGKNASPTFAALLLGTVALLFASTVHTPAYDLLRRLPGLAWFRVPQRVLLLTSFAVAVASGLALETLWRRAARPSKERLLLWVLPLGVAVALAPLAPGDRARVALLASGSLLVLYGLARTPWVRRGAVSGLVFLLAGELYFASANPEFRPYHQPGVFRAASDLYSFLRREQGLGRTYVEHELSLYPWTSPKRAALERAFVPTDYEPLSPRRHERLFALLGRPLGQKLRDAPFSGFLATSPDRPHFGLLDLLSVRFVVAPLTDRTFTQGLERRGWWRVFVGHGKLAVYENPRPLPRAYVVTGPTLVGGIDEALRVLSLRGFDPRETAVVEVEQASSRVALQVGDERRARLASAGVFDRTCRERDEAPRIGACRERNEAGARLAAREVRASPGLPHSHGKSSRGGGPRPGGPGRDGTGERLVRAGVRPVTPHPADESATIVPARIVSYRASRVVVEAEAERPAYLVLADSYYPGWRATVDGKPTRIHPANVAFRAVELPPGRHRVIFEYRPWSFRAGAGISLVGLLALCFLLVRGLVWR